MGAKFWLGLVGIALAAGLGALILFLIFGWAWGTFGFFGMFVLFGGVALLAAWVSDRRQERHRRELAE